MLRWVSSCIATWRTPVQNKATDYVALGVQSSVGVLLRNDVAASGFLSEACRSGIFVLHDLTMFVRHAHCDALGCNVHRPMFNNLVGALRWSSTLQGGAAHPRCIVSHGGAPRRVGSYAAWQPRCARAASPASRCSSCSPRTSLRLSLAVPPVGSAAHAPCVLYVCA
jgi:hypothetical protein